MKALLRVLMMTMSMVVCAQEYAPLPMELDPLTLDAVGYETAEDVAEEVEEEEDTAGEILKPGATDSIVLAVHLCLDGIYLAEITALNLFEHLFYLRIESVHIPKPEHKLLFLEYIHKRLEISNIR